MDRDSGFDAPLYHREDDHLSRWPLAREVYGIATTGPKEWSVRVGIYGEWGTGKTTVLKFIGQMADKNWHVVVWFNPWQRSSKAELWKAFVLAVFETLESRFGQMEGAQNARRKAWMDKAKDVVKSVTGIINDHAEKLVESGIDLVKKHFSFGKADLQGLQDALADKRVLVLIDDLDRTAPELVPEILFALKELMDVPGFSFICAFDPALVGEVLGQYHPGFGDGLKFLEKIIDYPRWLAPASAEGLLNLALADAKKFCEFVPEQTLREAVTLLPSNPRAIRQFIRLLALIRPQIERHDEKELCWPVILAANVLKIRHPRIAHAVLNDGCFWSSIEFMRMTLHGENEQEKLDKTVSEHIQKTAQSIGLRLEVSDQKALEKTLSAICSHFELFLSLNQQGVAYQVNVAEAPAAVTWKEFDQFLVQWERSRVPATAQSWVNTELP